MFLDILSPEMNNSVAEKKEFFMRPFQVLCKFKKLIQDMSFVTLGRADFLRFCPCLYYNAVSRHVKQGWLGQP